MQGEKAVLKQRSQAVVVTTRLGSIASERGRRRRSTTSDGPCLASSVTTFSLSTPPPFDVRAADHLAEVLKTLPKQLQKHSAKYEADAVGKDAILLATHTFWYVFVTLQLPEQEHERMELVRLMSVAHAQLTLGLTCDRDAFFEQFPLLVAHATLAALRHHQALGDAPPEKQGPEAAAVFRHVVTLLGGRVPGSEELRAHMRFAERGEGDADAAAGRRAIKKNQPFHAPWSYAPTPGPPQPPLAPPLILPLPELPRTRPAPAPAAAFAGGAESGSSGGTGAAGRSGSCCGACAAASLLKASGGGAGGAGGASAWKPMRSLLKAQQTIESAQQSKRRMDVSKSSDDLLLGRRQPYRPVRVAVDLRRSSPLVQVYSGKVCARP